MRVAINQPYFAPYAGWYRLLTADVFVLMDDVQHIRRGWVNRCQLTRHNGQKGFLTLPIKHSDRDTTRIMDLEWAEDAGEKWDKQLRKFSLFDADNSSYEIEACKVATQVISPFRFVEILIGMIRARIGMSTLIIRSSSLNIPPQLRGQERIIRICKELSADTYINSPGGRNLYDVEEFSKNGIDLKFLPDFDNKQSILERIFHESPCDIRKEIYGSL